MTVMVAFEAALAMLLVAVAGWSIGARDAFAAVVVFVVYGLLLAIVWVQLSAIDVALTEAAIGSGLTGALLLGAATRLRVTETLAAEEGPSESVRFGAALLSAMMAAALAASVFVLSDPAPTLAPLAEANAAATGLGNPVTNVLMAFRAMDTLLEKVVLLLALVGIWSLMPDRLWGERSGRHREADPGGALSLFARLLPPVGIVVALYILWVGADHPGGAFQAGAILAAMWLLALMAGLADAPAICRRRLRLMLTAGPMIFLVVGLGGLWIGSAFLAYPAAFAKPLILAIECAMTLTVAVTLGLLAGGPEWSAER
jgi:multisubunit Na+/H+ antiporter MnhB subunit